MKRGPKKKFSAFLTLRLSDEVLERLRRKAEAMGITLSAFLRLALASGVEGCDDKEEGGHAS